MKSKIKYAQSVRGESILIGFLALSLIGEIVRLNETKNVPNN